eukprot:GHVH01003144.1.p1 GENE.GHVH01003144.1~~GHVH01003144.1.p1  ORF type:complete len:903 (-),score=131.91 GHVH01003144.1:3626-6334(-)
MKGSGAYSEIFGGGGWQGMREYMQEKNKRIQRQLEQSTLRVSNLFDGCFFDIDGRTIAASDLELKKLIVSHGGRYEAYGNKVTHLIADQVAEGNQSWQRIRNKQAFSKRRVVTSQYVMDCIKAGKRLEESGYLPESLRDQVYRHSGLTRFLIPKGKVEEEEVEEVVEEEVVEEEVEFDDMEGDIDCHHPKFVDHYFSKSRLHLLGSFKQEILYDRDSFPSIPFELLVPDLTDSVDYTTGRLDLNLTSFLLNKQKRPKPSGILYVDYDAFFLEASLQSRAETSSSCVGVAHGQGPNSELSSVSYPARAMGVRAGQSIRKAKQLCSDFIVVPYDFDAVKRCSKILYDVLFRVSPRVAVIGIDEGCVQLVGADDILKANVIAAWIRQTIKEETGGMLVSIGFGATQSTAKLAATLAKPHNTHEPLPIPLRGVRWVHRPSEGVFFLPPLLLVQKGQLPLEIVEESMSRLVNPSDIGVDDQLYQVINSTSLYRFSVGMTLASLHLSSVHSVGPKMSETIALSQFKLFSDLYKYGINPLTVSSTTTESSRDTPSSVVHYLSRLWPFSQKSSVTWRDTAHDLTSLLGREVAKRIICLSFGNDLIKQFDAQNKEKDIQINLNYGIRLKTDDLDQLINLVEQLVDNAQKRLELRRLVGASMVQLSYLVRYPGAPKVPQKYGACGYCYITKSIVPISSPTWSRGKQEVISAARVLAVQGGLSVNDGKAASKLKGLGYWVPKQSILARIASDGQCGGVAIDDIRGIQMTLMKVIGCPTTHSTINTMSILKQLKMNAVESDARHAMNDNTLVAVGYSRHRMRLHAKSINLSFNRPFNKSVRKFASHRELAEKFTISDLSLDSTIGGFKFKRQRRIHDTGISFIPTLENDECYYSSPYQPSFRTGFTSTGYLIIC